MTRHITLVDVTQLAGVSGTAASLALTAPPGSRLSAETIQRVHEAARQLATGPTMRLGACGSARPGRWA